MDHGIERPPPLTPANCDLRDFAFMPLDVARLRRSKAWLKAKRNPALAFYLINLWTASWHDVPAASLEDDDDVLADLAMCDPAKWAKVREEVLRGWVKCSDGRLYHPTVAEKAHDAWQAKLAQRARTEAARQAKELKRQQTLSQTTQATSVTDSVTEVVTGSKGEGQGEGQGQGDSIPVAKATAAGAAKPVTKAKPKAAPDPVKQEIWDTGRRVLVAEGLDAAAAGAFLGKLLKDYGQKTLLEVVRDTDLANPKPMNLQEWMTAACLRATGRRLTPVGGRADRAASFNDDLDRAVYAHVDQPNGDHDDHNANDSRTIDTTARRVD